MRTLVDDLNFNFRRWRRRAEPLARLESLLARHSPASATTPFSILFRYSLFENHSGGASSEEISTNIPMTAILVNGRPISETHDGRADMTNFEMDLFDTRINEVKTEKGENGGGGEEEENGSKKRCLKFGSSRNRIIKPACVPISIVSLLIIALVFLPLFNEEDLASPIKLTTGCTLRCNSFLVETIPTGVPFHTDNHTADAWIDIIESTKKYLDISVMYWNLNTSDSATAQDGRRVFEALIRAGRRGVKIRIAQDGASDLSTNEESAYLAREKLAEVREINVTRLIGSGIIHTKFILSDISTLYIGSANMDWKSLSEVKEVGVVVEKCPCVASDLYKIFAAYWKLGENSSVVPDKWPISYRTPFNFTNMAKLNLDGEQGEFFISSSPAPFNPKGREHDLAAIQKTIRAAKQSVCISVMDYIPATIYMKNGNRFWSEIDDAIRDAAFRGVHVRMLISHWDHSRKEMLPFLKSLEEIEDGLPWYHNKTQRGKVEVRIFTVPPGKTKIPFTRVNHAKYMVTEDIAYIGTSNWSGDYFITTAGVAMVVRQPAATKRLQTLFDRDWSSEYAAPLSTSV